MQSLSKFSQKQSKGSQKIAEDIWYTHLAIWRSKLRVRDFDREVSRQDISHVTRRMKFLGVLTISVVQVSGQPNRVYFSLDWSCLFMNTVRTNCGGHYFQVPTFSDGFDA